MTLVVYLHRQFRQLRGRGGAVTVNFVSSLEYANPGSGGELTMIVGSSFNASLLCLVAFDMARTEVDLEPATGSISLPDRRRSTVVHSYPIHSSCRQGCPRERAASGWPSSLVTKISTGVRFGGCIQLIVPRIKISSYLLWVLVSI
jgi:hypothetical protein